MGVFEIILIGLLINVLTMVGAVVWNLSIRKDIGEELYGKIIKSAPKYHGGVFILWLIPFIGVYSVLSSLYSWNKIDADNTVERLDKYIKTKPSFLGKYFMKSNTKGDNE